MSGPPASGAGPAGGAGAWVQIARVVRARGLQGELVVRTHSDDPQILLAAEQVMLEGRPGALPHRVLERRPLKQLGDRCWLVALRLAGIASRDQAELWLSAAVQVPAQALEAARGEDLYWSDVIGMQCRGTDGELLGRVREIWARPSQDLLVLEGPQGEQLLVPAAEPLLRRVDLERRELWLELPEPGGEPV